MTYTITKTTYSITAETQELLKRELIDKVKNSWIYSDDFKKFLTIDNVKCEITRELIGFKVYYDYSYTKTTTHYEDYKTGDYSISKNINGSYDISARKGSYSYETKERKYKYGLCAAQKCKLSEDTLKKYTLIHSEPDENDEWAKDYKKVVEFINKKKRGIFAFVEDTKIYIKSIELTYCEKIKFTISYGDIKCATNSSFFYANEKKYNLKFSGDKSIYCEKYAKKYAKLNVLNKLMNIANGFLSVICYLALVPSFFGIIDYIINNCKAEMSVLLIVVIIIASISVESLLHTFIYKFYKNYIKSHEDDVIERILLRKIFLFILCFLLCLINVIIIYFTLCF